MRFMPLFALILMTSLVTPTLLSAQSVVVDPPQQPTVWITPQRRPIIMPGHDGGIELIEVDVTVDVRGRAATTTMDLTVSNTGSRPAEGVLLVPVPAGAVVGAFSYDGEGIEPTARLLQADEARRIYDDIVRRAKDPALLEFAGWNLVRSSVFPVPAGATQHVRISWDQVLPADAGRIDLSLPRSEAVDDVAWNVTVNLTESNGVGAIYSPSHDVTVNRRTDGTATVTSKVTGTSPFLLSWLRKTDDGAATVYTFPDPTIDGGYFLLLVGMPEAPDDRPRTPREVTIVLDRSGSMAGEKMRQARAAASQIIAALGEDEAFNIIDYSTTVERFSPHPLIATDDNRRAAEVYLAAIRPNGGTNIHDALLEAIRQPASEHRRSIVLFLTDGLPTVGRTSEHAIRDMVEAGNRDHRRIFTFGVGEDVNAPLLDRVAAITRASSSYVLPQEDVEVKVASVFNRLSGPVFGDVELTTFDADGQPSTQLVHDLVPTRLPDLFDGEDLVLLGKYRGIEPTQFSLDGQFLGSPRSFDFSFDLDAMASTRNAFVPRLWAGQRVAHLIDDVRQRGARSGLGPGPSTQDLLNDPEVAELIEEIVRLSLAHGILTEYTAFLATDGSAPQGPITAGLQVRGMNGLGWLSRQRVAGSGGVESFYFARNSLDDLAMSCAIELKSKAIDTRSGQAAVTQALSLGEQMKASNLASMNRWYAAGYEVKNAQQAVKQCHDRTFLHNANVWIDSTLIDGNAEALEPDEIVSFGSEAWNAVVAELIETGRAAVLGLGGPVLLELNNRLVLICGPDDDC